MATTPASPTIETSNDPILKRGLAWAGLAAIGGCAAMCSLPMSAAALVGGAAVATAVASFVTPGVELAVGGMVFALVLGLAGLRAHAKRRRSSRQCASPDSSGTPARPNEIPIACDPFVFSSDERKAHHDLARDVIVRWPTQREELADGYQFHYDGNEELFLTLARWASSEHRCCSWASFAIEMDPFTKDAPGAIRLQMRGPGEAKKLLADAFTLLEGDPRAELFLNPTGKITAEAFSKARSSSGHGCGC